MLKGGDEEMKKVIAVVMGVVLLLSLVPAGVVLADKPSDEVTGEYKGNKAPSEKHFNLNIIGFEEGVPIEQ